MCVCVSVCVTFELAHQKCVAFALVMYVGSPHHVVAYVGSLMSGVVISIACHGQLDLFLIPLPD